jgi:hypothetical protein
LEATTPTTTSGGRSDLLSSSASGIFLRHPPRVHQCTLCTPPGSPRLSARVADSILQDCCSWGTTATARLTSTRASVTRPLWNST